MIPIETIMPPSPSGEVQVFVDHLFRHQAGQMVATLTRIFGIERLDQVEDAVQDALVCALRQWPYEPIPDNPRAWLIQVAKNRLLDRLRRERRWGSDEEIPERYLTSSETAAEVSVTFSREMTDDQLGLIFTCCHPTLSHESQVALTLKTVGGFNVGEIARAFLAKEQTVTKMLVRARQRLREHEARFEMPAPEDLPARLDSVLQVVYLMFNEGYAALEGEDLVRTDLCGEAIRLCELLSEHPVTETPKVHALAALLCFQGARLNARSETGGGLVVLSEQDRSLWDSALLHRGLYHLRKSAQGDELSDYHLEAEIASCHALARSFESTDWRRMLDCYDELQKRRPGPVVALNRLVALARVEGAEAALTEIKKLQEHRAMQHYFPLYVTFGELLQEAGRSAEAIENYRRALDLTSSTPLRRFVEKRISDAQGGETFPTHGPQERGAVGLDCGRLQEKPATGCGTYGASRKAISSEVRLSESDATASSR